MSSRATAAISFVVAGTGDAEQLTVRAHRLLSRAALVVSDLESHALAVEVASGEVVVAQDANGIPLSLAARTKVLADAAKAGQSVVRLLAGDPVLDGRLALETAAVAKAGLAFDIAPGLSTVNAAAAHAGVSLTGGKTRQVHVLDVDAPTLDWNLHVDSTTTLVLINAADRVADIAKSLVTAGRDENTPVAVVRDGGTIEQRSIHSTLGEVGAATKQYKHTGAGVVIVGEPVAERTAWFEVRPLHGWRVLIPRTKAATDELQATLAGFGAVPFEVATMSVEPPRTPQQMERAIHGLVSGRFEWVAFTSVNAVRAIKERFDATGLDARALSGIRVAAAGADTIEALVAMGVRPDLVPEGENTTSGLLDVWPEYDSLVDPINRVFLPRADIATDTLVAGLAELGWEVEDVTAFRTVRATPPAPEVREAIKAGGFDAVVFTSSSTVRNLVGIAGKPHPATVVACIGPQTAKVAQEHGLNVDVLPEDATIDALAAALAAHGVLLRDEAQEQGAGAWRPSRRRSTAARRR